MGIYWGPEGTQGGRRARQRSAMLRDVAAGLIWGAVAAVLFLIGLIVGTL